MDEDTCEHNWVLVIDSGGDPGVINGTWEDRYWECTECGDIDWAYNRPEGKNWTDVYEPPDEDIDY